MNELAVITGRKFENKGLQKATDRISKIGENVTKSMFEVAHIVAEVEKNKYFLDDGFKTVHEWTKETFGIAKTASYNMLRIGTEYTEEVKNASGKLIGYKSNLTDTETNNDFSTSQIIQMLPVSRETAVELIENDEINASMSCREIAEIIKNIKSENEAIEADETGEGETDETEEVIEGEATDKTEVVISREFALELFKEVSKGKTKTAQEITQKFAEILGI